MDREQLTIIVGMLVLMMAFISATAGNLALHLQVDGGLDARLDGLLFSATIDGNLDLVGDVPCDDGVVWISAMGSITGIGFYSFLELMTNGWILLTAEGITDRGDVVVFRSLLYASRQSLVPLKAGDLFEGVHHTMIQVGGATDVYWGEFTGTLVGGLAPMETEGSIRLTGSGNFSLLGQRIPEARPDDYPLSIPLDDPNLTEAFLQAIDAFFDLPIAVAPVSVGDSP